jgi:hypothetical protein|tara:strand:+ start:213 stop:557 length:345 start_codon:yes stop_codon:yes gene_type:complete
MNTDMAYVVIAEVKPFISRKAQRLIRKIPQRKFMPTLTVLQILETNGITRMQVFYSEKQALEHAQTLRDCDDVEEVIHYDAEWMDTSAFISAFQKRLDENIKKSNFFTPRGDYK